MKRSKIKHSRSNQVFYIFNTIFWIIFMFLIIYPLYSETEEQLQLLQDLMLRRTSRDSLMYPPGIFPNVVLQLSEKFSFK